ncbi:polysaccharide deacetylase family protein [Nordella sp. HKS 07]|uniref:polysaccharide deacetylase family protein n=1 Tax=Nordella sp. HKS 07 TaxID=2712222 RepID=UPI0013E12702|nr:polysaccharide deacetylase family protein [Nordella sp. HKS 07]QIG49737.1 polysaccharide deacetylase family protein [Nordella sp. HKS 07]
MRRVSLIAVLSAVFLGSWTASGQAAQNCQGALPERVLSLSEAKITSFGTLQKLPPLPLEAGEYVLTFDDGPSYKTTPRILEELRAACLHATFFMVGQRALQQPFIARLVKARGHSIGNHTYSHRKLNQLPLAEATEEMKRGAKAIEWAVYGNRMTPVRLFRFPENAGTPDLLETAARLDMIVASYDISPEDWRNHPPAETMRRLRQRLNANDRGVIVMHDIQTNTVPLLPMVIDELKSRNAKIVHLVE